MCRGMIGVCIAGYRIIGIIVYLYLYSSTISINGRLSQIITRFWRQKAFIIGHKRPVFENLVGQFYDWMFVQLNR